MEVPCLGSDMADVASLTDFLPELHPKSQPGFAPTIPVTGLIALPAQDHFLTSSPTVSVLVTPFALLLTPSSLDLPPCYTHGQRAIIPTSALAFLA